MNESLQRGTVGAPVLAVRRVDMTIGGRTLVGGLSLEIRAGERWCLLGANGSGKTSLLRVLSGVARPTRGEVLLRGTSYRQWDQRLAARERAFLAQGESYAFRSAVRECVMLGRHPHIGRFGWAGADDRAIVDAALEVMDLRTVADRDVRTLSGGEQQRTRIAALIAQAPGLFLMDEPTAHLDLKHQAALFRHLTALCETDGRALIFSTHELGLAGRYATHALVLCGDGAVRWGASTEILADALLSDAFDFPIEACPRPGGPPVFSPRW